MQTTRGPITKSAQGGWATRVVCLATRNVVPYRLPKTGDGKSTRDPLSSLRARSTTVRAIEFGEGQPADRVSTLTWQLNAVSGQQNFASESTVYGFTVWAATSTGVIQKVVSLPKTATSLSGVSHLVPADANFTQLYVEMVGMPLILNQMSNGTTYP